MAEKSLEEHLYECLKEGNTKKALYIINLLGDKVYELYGARSLLVIAREFENKEVARVLEEKGVNEIVDEEKAKELGKELMNMADKGNVEAVENLIELGADVNQKDNEGWTPLMYASYGGRLEIIKKLIEAKADINQKDKSGDTALMLGFMNDSLEIVDTLIENGADVSGENGIKALMRASQKKVILRSLKNWLKRELMLIKEMYMAMLH